MPEICYYTVTQEREVKVTATSPTDAVRIADYKFRDVPHPVDVAGYVLSDIRIRDISAREDH